jgi:hypothetical protein
MAGSVPEEEVALRDGSRVRCSATSGSCSGQTEIGVELRCEDNGLGHALRAAAEGLVRLRP